MRRMSMDQSFTRGAAAAALALGALVSASPARAQGGAVVVGGQPRQARDSFFVRVIDGSMKATIDSIMVMMRMLDDRSALSDDAARMRREVEARMQALVMA